jgi:hypothetical protein
MRNRDRLASASYTRTTLITLESLGDEIDRSGSIDERVDRSLKIGDALCQASQPQRRNTSDERSHGLRGRVGRNAYSFDSAREHSQLRGGEGTDDYSMC